jgi:trk system potassium uptake protein TrkH
MDLRPVGVVIGLLLAMLALVMLVPSVVDWASDGPDWPGFFAAAGLTAFLAGALILATRGDAVVLDLRQAFLLTCLAWLAVAACSALPFTLAATPLPYADAFFEAMSGLTTTGSTVITTLDRTGAGILIWRSLLHFIGGVGIIVLAVAVLPFLRIGGMQLFRLESSDKSDKVLPRATQIAAGIAIVYALLTALCALAFWCGGMSGFDAVAHAMGTLATGGFSNYDASFAQFDSWLLEAICTVFMLCGGLTLTLFLRVARGQARTVLRDRQIRVYLAVFAATSAAIALWLILVERRDMLFALRHAPFTVASVMTTTGFASTDWGLWGPFPLVLIFLLTFVGGCSGSTSGGIKIFRFQVLVAVGHAQLRRALQPSAVWLPKYNDRPIADSVAQSVLAFVAMYMFSWAATALLLGLCGLDLVTALTGAATALGNVGPGLGDVIGPAGTFAPLPSSAKWVLSGAMLLGRLELVTVLVLFSGAFWRT